MTPLPPTTFHMWRRSLLPTLPNNNYNKIFCKSNVIIRSNITNPHANLAIEEWLFRERGDAQGFCLFLWRNSPCMVVGRNQNPWIECNIPWLTHNNIPIIRRYSGGGAVYHDFGNSLYSVMMPREEFCRRRFAQMIISALKEYRPLLRLSPRHDIFHGDCKVSGSAYRLVRNGAYHHGTFLLDADLNSLGISLRSPLGKECWGRGAAVTSVPSSVTNIGTSSDSKMAIDHEFFCDRVTEQFRKEFPSSEEINEFVIDESIVESVPVIRDVIRELETNEWTFDKTPPFELKVGECFVRVEEGIVTKSSHPEYINCRFSVNFFTNHLIKLKN